MSTVSTTSGTYLSNLFNPQVIADIIDSKLINNIVLAPLAVVDTTLEGRAGNTVSLPYYTYIGMATTVAEGTDIPIKQLTQTTKTVTIVKYGVATQLTDEAALSGYGDPLGEAASQVVLSVADAVDGALLASLAANTTNVYETASTSTALAPSDIPLALAKFGENIEGEKALLVTPDFYAQLVGSNWIPASEIAADIRIRGAVGMAYGCQVIVSNRLVTAGNLYIVKPGALGLFLRRDTFVETDRDILNESTVIKASKMVAAYLMDPTKAVTMKVKS